MVAISALQFACHRYYAQGANFDGTNDHLTRGAGLTSVVDGKSGLLSFWLNIAGSDGADHTIIANTAALGQKFYCARSAANKINLVCTDVSNNFDFVLNSSTSVIGSSGWVHVLVSWDVNAAAAHLYLSDASDLAGGAILTNDTLDYTTGAFAVGAETDGGRKLTGDLAEVWVKFNTYLDLSVEANRRKFITSTGKPAFLGATGQLPLGSAPDIYLRGPVSGWHTNLGTGGGFTVNGALTASSTSPSD